MARDDWTHGERYAAADHNALASEFNSVAEDNANDVETGDLAGMPRFRTGTCATAAATVAKTVTLDEPWAAHVPAAGDWFLIKYTNGHSTSVSGPTLAIN